MINKLIIDGANVELDENSTPYYHTFPQAKVHTVKYGLDNTNEVCAYAFEGCKDLTYISLPPAITMIKRGAFKNCSSLPTITIGEQIEYIGKEAFDGCRNLSEIVFMGEDPDAIDVNCSIPDSTTCFVPNGSKYAKVENFDDIDPSGDTKYFTRTAWNQYQEVRDVTMISPEDFDPGDNHVDYYVNRWSNIATGDKLREVKDKVPVSSITFRNSMGDRISETTMSDNSLFEFSYEINPANATNLNLYWFSTNPKIHVNGDISEEGGQARIETDTLTNVQTIGTVSVYSESGQYATLRVNVFKG